MTDKLSAEPKPGDTVSIQLSDGIVQTGILMPRPTLCETKEEMVSLKLKTGYNIGIKKSNRPVFSDLNLDYFTHIFLLNDGSTYGRRRRNIS